MTGRIAADIIGEQILALEDFRSLIRDAEQTVAEKFLTDETTSTINTEDAGALLRYADILSHSTVPNHREAAYATIALLRELQEMIGFPEYLEDRVLAVSEAVLIQLGNFPGLQTLWKKESSKFAVPLDRGVLRAAKEIVQRTKHGNATYTDAQFQIAERMQDADFFSFSGPTSLGKSFILKDALYDIVQRSELNHHCVIVLVPTKALIGQTAADLRDLLRAVPEVNIATFPSLPRFLRQKYPRTVFVFTPERLLRYLANPVRDIDYLVVDEAQKIIAKNDTRSSIYYHAIVETTRRFATKLIFASPGIENPELFLELFGRARDGALAVHERTVAQQRFFVDLVDRNQFYFPSHEPDARQLSTAPTATDAVDLIRTLSGTRKAIVYINSSLKSAEFALQLAAVLPIVDDPEIDLLIKFTRDYIHKDYFLLKSLKCGVAFHHGKMPQDVREKIEQCFADPTSKLQFIVCTSTLLEGVNLPAKNIFVLNDKHGPANFSKLDFENLAGRAGRLTYDFSGNVVCVRHASARWSDSTRALIPRGRPFAAESFLVNPAAKRRKEYTDIGRVLRGERLPGKPSVDAKRSVQQYASILMLHYLDKQQTPLRTHFLERVNDGGKLLDRVAAEFSGPVEVLRRSPGVLPKYQNQVWNALQQGTIGPLVLAGDDLADFEMYEEILVRLGDLYNWIEEESPGRDSLVPPTQPGYRMRLRYWALLMRTWVRGDPLSMVISNAIAHHVQNGSITYEDYSTGSRQVTTEPFNAGSAKHINLVIYWTMRDLEGGLRFKITGYLENYYDLSSAALGKEGAGINVAALVEYGSPDPKVIELQQIGFSRGVALKLVDDHADCLIFSDNDELESIDDQTLLRRNDIDPAVIEEAMSILSKTDPEL
ncbi:DEAD/DEAH box helicase [Rhodococcus erythropolis]|uniref:DEAD/DEAH box helicase n=1 Tax=Rhodococcus erythropolis TaxID=1833 RepID=A0AAX3ZZM9_RHOER|nr:DEAD/DEAH box helicase [Rhodococcus erythropolis]WMN03096.1 DEAD/DEAH box helicase [Rhodococcus erythropolis]